MLSDDATVYVVADEKPVRQLFIKAGEQRADANAGLSRSQLQLQVRAPGRLAARPPGDCDQATSTSTSAARDSDSGSSSPPRAAVLHSASQLKQLQGDIGSRHSSLQLQRAAVGRRDREARSFIRCCL